MKSLISPATSYSDSGLMAARKSWYRIRAFNSIAVSQWRAVVSINGGPERECPNLTPVS